MEYMFNNCGSLETIPILKADSCININSVFDYANKLANFGGFENLGKAYTRRSSNYYTYSLNLNYANSFTHDSLINVINGLYDLNLSYDVANGGTLYPQNLALGNTNKSKLTEEEIAIATNKGWNVV